MVLALVMAICMLPTAAFAASIEEEALGEADIYNGGAKFSYLSMNGQVQSFLYTYYLYTGANGQTQEIPAYRVNPNLPGVPQTVAPGESIKYMANEKASDPKVMGIVANGYPTRGAVRAEAGKQGAGLLCYQNRIVVLPDPVLEQRSTPT